MQTTSTKADMDIGPFPVASIGKVLNEAAPSPIITKGNISKKKPFNPRWDPSIQTSYLT